MPRMTRVELVVLAVSILTLTGCTPLSPEMQVVHEAGEALGGVDDIAESLNLVLEGTGRQYRLGQNRGPNAELPFWEIDDYVREIDLVNAQWRVSQERTSMFLTGNPALRQPQVIGLDGDLAYTVGADGTAIRASAQDARDRLAEHYHYPPVLVYLALQEGSTVSNLRQEGGQNVVDVTSAAGLTFTLHADPETGLISMIVSAGYHPNLGDVTLTTEFGNYEDTAGLAGFETRLTLPRLITSRVDDLVVSEFRVEIAIDQDIDDLSAPEEARLAAPAEFQADIQVEEVAAGVWLLGGQSHHSVLIEFDEYLALVEAPQNEARTLAVIAQARELAPDKPLRYVVNTHHHFDHSGGIRAAVAEGLTVVTHEINGPFMEEIVRRPHTTHPDTLMRNPQPLTLELVMRDEVYELGGGRQTLQLVRIFEDEHSAGILMGYLPRERILIEVDAYSPASRAAPFAANLLKNVDDMGWEVDRIVPLHGGVVDFSELETAVEAEALRL
jgi:glyoxylase-like metal-dependent hydrolase (beta-lactamase superfamily II)